MRWNHSSTIVTENCFELKYVVLKSLNTASSDGFSAMSLYFKKEIGRYTIMMEPWAPCVLSHKLRYWVRLGESVPLKQFEDHA